MESIQTEWNAVLRQAVIRVKPDYFALSETEREYYRLRLNTEDDFRIRQTVIKELFGIAISMTEELDVRQETQDHPGKREAERPVMKKVDNLVFHHNCCQ